MAAFSVEANNQLRELAWQLRRKHKSDRAFAASLGVAQPPISKFLKGGTVGAQIALAIAHEAGVPICFDGDSVRFGHEVARSSWSRFEWWNSVLAQARELFPRVSDAAWHWLGSLSGADPPRDALALGTMAATWEQATARTTADGAPQRAPKSIPIVRDAAGNSR